MCLAPDTLPNGQQIACRKCKLCKQNRVKDWAGRNVAQSKVSTASFAGDLTYGPELDEKRMPIPGRSDHIRAAVLTYSDVQKFLKYLRWLGYEFDYFITGEMGSQKGRCHWHFILHFKGKVPKVVLGKNFSDRHKNEQGELFDFEVCKAWPHGFMFWKKAVYEDCFYNCKYILKDEGDDKSQRKPGMSKKPPIGAEYFERIAEQAVAQGIPPQTLSYRLPGINKKKTKEPVEFYLQGRSAELYLDHFIKTWAEKRGDQPRPKSDLVDLYEQYGQIVHDENALLQRRNFPKGESREKFPSGEKIKAMGVEAMKEKEQWAKVQAELNLDHWWMTWVKEAGSVEERQRREAERYEFYRERADQEYARTAAGRSGKRWDKERAEWVDIDPDSARSGEGGDPNTMDRPAAESLGDDARGPVGEWNHWYGNGARTG